MTDNHEWFWDNGVECYVCANCPARKTDYCWQRKPGAHWRMLKVQLPEPCKGAEKEKP